MFIDLYVFNLLTLIAIADIKTMSIPWSYLILLLPLVKLDLIMVSSYIFILFCYIKIAKWIGGADINIAYILWGIYSFNEMVIIIWLASLIALVIEQKRLRLKQPIAFLVYIYFSFCIWLLLR